MELIKAEKVGKFGIVLQYFGREVGYEVAVSHPNFKDSWYDSDGMYSTKRDGLKAFTRMKREYKKKLKGLK